MKYLFFLLLVIHGLIHLMGFINAFGIAQLSQLTKEISRPAGSIWLLTTLLFIISCILFLLKKDYWWVIAIASVLLSQALIITCWKDAKFGTIANVIILLITVPAWAESHFVNQYKGDVARNLTSYFSESLVTQVSISHLPEPVQRYIIYSGAINKPVVKNFKIKFEGQIRSDEKSAWMPFTTEQYNVIDPPTRLFFMKATMKGLPVAGYHTYEDGKASMDIRLLSLVTVQFQDGDKMNISETVTWFNDLCLFAPGALLDQRITWEPIDSYTTKATFTHQGITISALLFFNDQGELVNFRSENRYRIVSKDDAQLIPFSTPTKDFKNINGHIIPAYGEAVWSLPEGDLTYGQFICQDIQYNIKN